MRISAATEARVQHAARMLDSVRRVPVRSTLSRRAPGIGFISKTVGTEMFAGAPDGR